MDDRNVITGMLTVALSSFIDFLSPLRWLAILGIVLIITDLRFGIKKARKREEEVRFSRAWRRTMNKIMDYTCWVLVAASLNKAVAIPLDFPLLPLFVMIWIYRIEIDSCYNNYCEYKGIQSKSLYKHIINLIKHKLDAYGQAAISEDDDKQ